MPRELFGSKAYHQALVRLGIQNPGEIPLGVPVQATAQFDDQTHLAEPIENIFWTGGDNVTGAAGTRAGFEIIAGPSATVAGAPLGASGGIRIHWVNVWSAGSMGFTVESGQTLSAGLGNTTPVRSGNMTASPTSQMINGRRVAALPAGSFKTRTSNAWIYFPPRGLYIPPGYTFTWLEDTQNADCHAFIHWEEIFAPGTRDM